VTGSYVLRRVLYKTYVDGAWRDSHPIFSDRVTPQADPAAVVLPDGRNWVAWLDNPQTGTAQLSWTVGASSIPVSARLLGRKSEPFALTDGTVLTLTGSFAGVDHYTVHKADFANINAATAVELVTAMNAQLTRATAAREKNGSISLSSVAAGAPARLAIDLSHSTTARALGFDFRNAVGTPGSWSEEIDWSGAFAGVSVRPGRHAELAAMGDPAGGVRLTWTTHRAGVWRIETAHWDDRLFVATASGLFLRSGSGAWGAVAALPSTDIRAIAVDANGTAWVATAAGVALRHPDGTIAALTPALPSPDVRDLVLGPDGTAWFATAAGIAIRPPNGTVTTLNTGSGLPSNDIKALARCDDGTLWAATAAGAVRIAPGGTLQVFNTTSGLLSNTVQGVAVDGAGAAYIATTAGLAIFVGGGFTVVDSKSGLASSDVRAVAVATDGTVWVATAGGVSQRTPAGVWSNLNVADGLASDDTRSLSLGPDGTVWVGTAAGVSTIAADGTVSNLDLLGSGTANPPARAVNTGWASPMELAAGGGGNREPCLAVDVNKRTWVVWSQRIGVGNPDESWGLHYRVYDPTTLTWGVDTILTAPPAGQRASDRTPGVQALPAGMRVYFASDRRGGYGLYSIDVTLTGTISPIVNLPDQASSDLAPTPVAVGKALWLIYRSDANVSLAQTGSSPTSDGLLGSVRVPDNGTVRRFAGTVAADLNDLNRLRTRRVFGDLLCYTPNQPDGAGTLDDTELYTRGTVGLYVSRVSQGAELTAQEVGRLTELLQRFIPINLRALIIVVEAADVELIDPTGTLIQDSYSDDYPFVSILGPVTDSAAAAMPGLSLLHANVLTDVSANAADPKSLARRTYFPPLQ
jgi:hypothetical protein